jgi:hypothetical protein
MNGESYVVRIYRREKKAAPARRGHDKVLLDGIVEEAEGGGRKSFHGIDQLWALLARAPRKGKAQRITGRRARSIT